MPNKGHSPTNKPKTMDRHLNSFQIPAGSMSSLHYNLYAHHNHLPRSYLRPSIIRKFTRNRMGICFVISILATLVAGFVEIKQKQVALESGLIDKPYAIVPISVFWLVPQYFFHGVAETFMSIGHLEFLYNQAPESMRSTATALFWLSASVGSYISTFLVSMVHWLITSLQVVNLVYYLICAKFYTFKPIQVHVAEDDMRRKMEELS